MSRVSNQGRDEWLQAVGEAIRQLRTQMGISQEALGSKAGLHRTYVSDMERGQRNPTVVTLLALARTLGTEASELLRTAERIMNEK